MKSFDIREVLEKAIAEFKKNWKFLVAVFVISAGVNFLLSFIGSFLSEQHAAVRIVFNLFSIVVQIVLNLGLIRIYLKVVKGEKTQFSDLYADYQKSLIYFAASLVSSVLIVLGIVLLIIPGIVLAVRLQFWPYFVVEERIGPIAALKKSWQMTKGHFFRLLIFDILVVVLLNFIGLLLLLVGLMVTAPISLLSLALVYRKLAGGAREEE